jgi:ferric-dicitrate binding protein FerR (iron transport regulator)
MSTHDRPPDDPASDHSLAVLMKAAGERRAPRAEAMERAREAARESWQRSLQSEHRTSRKKILFALAAAAAFVVVTLSTWLGYQRQSNGEAGLVAHVVASEGTIELREGRRIATTLGTQQPLFTGAHLQTGEGRMALQLGSLSLRLKDHTRVTLDAADRITLIEGAIYVDSGGLNVATPLRIATSVGEVTHHGTQFQVVAYGETARISVREGRVVLDGIGARQTFDIVAGEALSMRGEKVERQRDLPAFGPDWEWVTELTPALDIENRPLAEFLAWVSREQGWQVRYASTEHERSAQTIRLHGSIEQLDTAQMLERITMVTGVPLAAENGVLVVGYRSSSGVVQ